MRASRTARGFSLSAVLIVCAAAAAPAAAEWRRVDSPNFVVIGEVGGGELRDIAVKFEGFRETLSRVLTERATATAVPTVVIVFPSDRAFTPFKPTFEGKPVELAGLFVGRRDINYIALVSDRRQERLRVVFHEYAHLVISNLARSIPTWLNEGLAEYYSTYEVSRGGREALLGRPAAEHLQNLADARLLPLEELLELTHDSPLYNEGNRRSVFYAQSWALTHLILLGEPGRSAQLSAYLARIAEGTSAAAAWKQAFGSANLDEELRSYIRRDLFRAARYRFPDKLAAFDAPAVQLPAADAQAFLADFLVQQRRYDEAARRLAAASKLDQGNPRVQTVMALLDIARQDHASAETRLLSLDGVSDWLVAYSAGVGIAELVEDRREGASEKHLQAARRLFEQARKLRPELPNALARLASIEIYATDGRPTAGTREAVERARSLAPGRHDYVLLHAQVLAGMSEFAAARNAIGPFISRAYPPEIREAARSLMGYVLQMEAANRARPAEERTAASQSGESARTVSQPPKDFQPVYRELEPGDQRLEAMLERIECLAGGAAVFHLRTADGPARAAAPQMARVDYISYREDVTGTVGCGTLPKPLPVRVSWRPSEGQASTKIVVAIEFVK